MSTYKSKVLIDLDSLLDTRLGTIAKIKPELVPVLLTSEDYYIRKENVFEGISVEAFNEAYAVRDVETLSLSSATLMCLELGPIVLDLLQDSQFHPLVGPVEVVINTYPYQLKKNEKIAVKNCVTHYTKETVEVSTVYLAPNEISTSMLKDTYRLMVTYDYGAWIEANAEKIDKVRVPELTWLVPALWFAGLPKKEELDEYLFEDEPIQAMELLMQQIINLQLSDVKYWCSVPITAPQT